MGGALPAARHSVRELQSKSIRYLDFLLETSQSFKYLILLLRQHIRACSVTVRCFSSLLLNMMFQCPKFHPRLIQWKCVSLPAGVRGSVTDPCAAGLVLPVQSAPSPQNRRLAAGTRAAQRPGEVRQRQSAGYVTRNLVVFYIESLFPVHWCWHSMIYG